MKQSYIHTTALMGTVVTIEVVLDGVGHSKRVADSDCVATVERAIEWFRAVEQTCSRFDPDSELRQLSNRIGEPVVASPIVFECVRFALSLACDTDGAFDPTVGAAMEARGFNRHYQTGRVAPTIANADSDASFRDVVIDTDNETIMLLKPLVLDLGAVAKGFAIDLAARELMAFRNFVIDAGGDLYVAGHNRHDELWSIGIRDPDAEDGMLAHARLSDTAVCTSGNYERRGNDGATHLLDPRAPSGGSPGVISTTVVASSAMVADGLSTAAFILGPQAGIDLMERNEVRGMIVSSNGERVETEGGWH